MPVTAICPECQATYKLAEALFGKQVRCKKCDTSFPVGKRPGGGKPVVKKTMAADDEAIREAGPSRPAAPTRKTARHAAPRARPDEDEEDLVEASAAAPLSKPRPRDEDDDFVDAAAAPARSRPSSAARQEDEPIRSRRRPSDDHFDERPRSRRDGDGGDDEFDADAPPRKSRKGMMIGLLLGLVVLLGGGGLVLSMLLRGGSEEVGGVVDTPEVAARLVDLREHRDFDGAVFFFANFETPQEEARRAEVAQAMETILLNNLVRPDLTDSLVFAYCKWASADNIPNMIAILDERGFNRIHQRPLRKQIMLTLAGFKEERAAVALANLGNADRGDAFAALETMGDLGKRELSKFVFDGSLFIRRDAKQALDRMGAKDEEFLDAALTVLGDERHPNRGAAADFLKDYRGDKTRSKEVCEKLTAVMKARNFGLSGNCANALPNWVTKDSVPVIVQAIQEADAGTNCEALMRTLVPYKDTPGVVEAIAKRLETGRFSEPDTALNILQSMGPELAGKALLSQMNTPNRFARDKVRLQLNKLGVSLQAMVAQSVKDLSSPIPEVRHTAVEYLSNSPVVPTVRDEAAKGLNALMFEENSWHRDRVFSALERWWSNDTMVVMCKAINDPGNSQLRHKCIDALAKFGEPKLAVNIAYRLKFNEDRGHAARALRTMGRAAEPYVAPYLLDSDSGVRGEALRVLEEIGSRASIPTLQKAMAAYNSDRLFLLSANRIGKTISMR